MGMDMYIDMIKRNPNDKSEVIEREQVCYWRKFWDLHHQLGLYGKDDYGNDIPMTRTDVTTCLAYICTHPDYFGSFSTVESVCKLLYTYEALTEDGWEIVYNADW